MKDKQEPMVAEAEVSKKVSIYIMKNGEWCKKTPKPKEKNK